MKILVKINFTLTFLKLTFDLRNNPPPPPQKKKKRMFLMSYKIGLRQTLSIHSCAQLFTFSLISKKSAFLFRSFNIVCNSGCCCIIKDFNRSISSPIVLNMTSGSDSLSKIAKKRYASHTQYC